MEKDEPPFNKEIFLTIELLSLFIVIFGTLMYNEMLIIINGVYEKILKLV